MWPQLFRKADSPSALHRPEGVWHWLPSQCAVCRSWPQAPLCDACISRFASPAARCQRCAVSLPSPASCCGACQKNPPPLDLCLTATSYRWPWRDLIADFKFHQQAGWARPLATLMHSTPWVEDTLAQTDWVLPVPLSAERLAERGYNQSWLLAQKLCPDKADPNFLLRTRHTPAQRTLPRQARLSNLKGAFALDPLRAPQLRGCRVTLVDDVMTSGASLHTAAQLLQQAGVRHISAIVLARTETDSED